MFGKRIIILLTLVLIGVVGISVLSPKLKDWQTGDLNPAPASPTPTQPPTGTFVDGLLGEFVFYRDGGFYHASLPSRQVTQLAGISEDVVSTFPRVRPAWSSDGKLFAIASDAKSLVVVNFSTGELVKRLIIEPALDLTKPTQISFSPDDLYLLLKQDLEQNRSQLRFYDLASGKLLTEQLACSPTGFWMFSQFTYISTCQIEGAGVIVSIDPSLAGSSPVKIAAGSTYKLINQFDSDSLLVTKGGKPGKLSLAGKFTPLDSKSFTELNSVEAFSDLPRALAKKIEEMKKTQAIDDLEVAPSNTFALFHTQKGLWIIDLPLKSEPYFLFPGELPSIRPL